MISAPDSKDQPSKPRRRWTRFLVIGACATSIFIVLAVLAYIVYQRSLPSWPNLKLAGRDGSESDRAMSGIVDKLLSEGRTKAEELKAQGRDAEALIALRDAADEAIRQLQSYLQPYSTPTWVETTLSRLKTFSTDLSNTIAEPFAKDATQAAIADDWDGALACLEILNQVAPDSARRRGVETMIVQHLRRLQQTKHPSAKAVHEKLSALQDPTKTAPSRTLAPDSSLPPNAVPAVDSPVQRTINRSAQASSTTRRTP